MKSRPAVRSINDLGQLRSCAAPVSSVLRTTSLYNARSRPETQPVDLIDIGANLTHKSFRRDLEAVLVRAREADVVRMVVTGTDEDESRAAAKLAGLHPGSLSSTAGVHPHNADTWSEITARSLAELAADPAVVAIGETGLDFYRNYSPHPAQSSLSITRTC